MTTGKTLRSSTPLRPLSFAIGVVLAVLAAVTRADADLWGHLRFGLDILRDRRLTAVDPYSFTQDRPWINHEWFSELQMGVAYALGGVTGLVILKTLLLVSVFAIVWTALSSVALRARLLVLLILVLGTIHMTSSLRPQLWTFLCFAVLFRVLAADWTKWKWGLPLLFAFWANCHGGWVVGAGVLVVWVAAEALQQRRVSLEWSSVAVLSLLATLVTPYGWHLWAFVLDTVHMNRAIAEWGPLWGTPFLNWIPWFIAVGLILAIAQRNSPSKFARMAVLAMLAYASARVMRIESLFVLAAAFMARPVLERRWPVRPVTAIMKPVLRWVAVALVIATVGVTARRDFAPFRCISIWGEHAPDLTAMGSLEHAQPGRMVTFFDWGEYALWHLSPTIRVSIDGRRETVYTDARLDDNDAILKGSARGFVRLTEWNPEYVWLPASSAATRDWLASHGYRLDVATAQSFVAVRGDMPRLPAPGEPRLSGSCFPG